MQTTTPLARVQALLPQLFQVEHPTGESYLKFALTEEISAILNLDQVQTTLVTPVAQITALPNLPEWVVGLINAQNQVFMVVDLPQVMGLPKATAAAQQYHIVVVRVWLHQQEIPVGLVVHRIQGLQQVETADILPPGDTFAPQFIPFLQGRALGKGGEHPLMVLDVVAIAHQLTRTVPKSEASESF